MFYDFLEKGGGIVFGAYTFLEHYRMLGKWKPELFPIEESSYCDCRVNTI